ncbi:MAG: S8 family peptidase [Chitinophagaceae bacterium]|nr:S8 family peptidase [Chitinophagaceae bacterium]
MKKLVLAGFLSFGSLISSTQAQNAPNAAKMSAFTRQYLFEAARANGKTLVPGYVYKFIGGQTFISAFIRVNSTVDENAITSLGAHTGTKAGNVWTVQIPVEKVKEFTTIAGITHIDLDMPVGPTLDQARKATKADSAQKGYNLPTMMTGKNVVVGVIDAGFDMRHPTLFDTLHSTYRVRRVWKQKNAGTPPAGYSYGQELTDPYVIMTSGTDTPITSHGTHVAGIAAGSGFGSASNNRYRGMAYESDLVLVGIMPAPYQWAMPGTSDIIDGMNYIFTYSASVFKSAVANLSWGSSIGPHDGNSFFSQACDALTGPGRIFACSAGNNGGDTIHLQKTFTASNNTVSTFVTFSPYLAADNQRTWLDVWGDTAKSFCLNFRLFNGPSAIDSTVSLCMADTTTSFNLVGSNGDTCFITVSMVANEYNGKPHAFLSFYSRVPDNICLTATGTSGTINMWEGYVFPPTGYYGQLKKLGYPFAVSGDTRMTTSDYSSTHSAISVGAYTSKAGFTNISGASLGYPGAVVGRIAPFSSMGPTADNRMKPDITGPGFALASGVSSYDTSYAPGGDNYNAVISKVTMSGRDYPYAMAAGTSMSSPAVSGIIALMLQVNPLLTPDSVKKIMRISAITDGFTGTIPATGSNTWGWGKINAYKALRYMTQTTEVENTLDKTGLDCILYPNPSTGNFFVNFLSNKADILTISVSDIGGRVVYSRSMPVTAGGNTLQIAADNLPKGLYFTRISNSENKIKVIKTIIH